MAAALGAAPAWASLGREASPLERGPHRVARALLGLSPGTTRLPVPEDLWTGSDERGAAPLAAYHELDTVL